MNNLDIIIIFIVTISALISVNRGFIREVLSIVGWVIGAIIVITALPFAMPIAQEHISNEGTAKIITSLLIFGAFMIFWMIFSSGVTSKIKSSKLGNIDKGLGLFFGLFRAFLLIILLFILVGFIYPPKEQPEVFKESKYFKIAGDFAEPIEKLIPKSTFKKLEATTKSTKETSEDAVKDTKESIKDAKKQAKEKVDDVKEKAKDAKEGTKQGIKETVEEVKEAPQNIEDLIGELGLE